MKIWIAELRVYLSFDDEYICEFTFEQSDREYVYNEGLKEYSYFKNWICETVPALPTIKQHMYGKLVVQGFDRELSDGELLKVKEQMKKMLIESLQEDLEYQLITYTHKIEAVRLEGTDNEI